MSEENVEIVRGMCEAFLAGRIDGAMDALDPEVRWHGTIGGLDEGRLYRGHQEVLAAFVENFENWESLRLEVERYIDAGDRVVAFWHEVARSRHSEAELTTDTGVIYTVDDGKVVEVQGYMDRTAALAGAGVQEDEATPG